MNSHDSTSSSPGTRRKPEQLDAKALACARRDALLRRARRIRRSVASLATLMFVTAFLVVYVQLASGHDPALVANAKRSASTEAPASESSGESSSSAGSGESSGESSSSASEEAGSGPAAVTTSQS